VVRILDGEATKTKVIDLEKLCNFVVDNFFIWNHLCNENYVWFLKFKIWIFQTISDGETLKTKLQISNVVQLCSWQLFNVKSFIQRKLRLIFLTIEIQILQMTSDGEMTKTKVIDLEES